ncbi:MAG: hypothetical protein PHP00_10390 [Thiotrichaceae bacterium]|nr:hypothetical protein [Thiotrichaceae bacterium]
MNTQLSDARVLIYHKHPTSARTVFLRLNNSVCLFEPLPELSQLLEVPVDSPVLIHPAPLLTAAEQFFGMNSGALEWDKEFHAQLDVPHGLVAVFLARCKLMDPPRELVAEKAAKFIALTEARGLPPVELELLRRAYSVIMEG